MTEFLTENARRAYPLEREWPSGMEAWAQTVVDASVSADAELGESRLSLLSVARTGSVLTFNVGIPGTYGVPVTFDRAAWTGGRTAVAYAAGTAEPRPFRTKLDFIESDGTQYVDTGVLFNFAEDLVLSGTVVSLSDNRSVIVGNYGDGRAAINVEFGGTANNRPRQFRLYTTKQGSPVAERWLSARPPNTLIDFTCTYTAQDATAYVTDGAASATFPLASGTVAPTMQTLLAFLDGRSDKSQIANGIRMYALGIRQGGVLVRDYIPVLAWDGDVKMFDLASQSYPAHYGTFAGGTVVEATPMPAEPPNPFRAKAFLTLNVEAIDALLAADAAGGEVGVPFATRCAGGAVRRVTAITAQGATPCEKPMYDPDGPHGVEKSVGANEHATLAAYDGVDIEVTSMLPLEGDMLRISAIAAPETTDIEQEPIDLMIRGDECFEVEAVPSADKESGIVRVTSTCKPCCDCEDYRDAVEMLRPAENKVHSIHQVLNAAKAAYEEALAAFNEAKARYVAQVNSPANVLVSAAAALSGGLYAQSTAEGSRMRITVTMLVENMTMVDVQVAVGDDPDDESDADAESGFVVGDGYVHSKTVWTKSGTPQEYDEGRPRELRTLKPGDTLTVAATYCKPNQRSNNASRPLGMKAYCTIQLPGQEAEVREVDVQ